MKRLEKVMTRVETGIATGNPKTKTDIPPAGVFQMLQRGRL